MGRLGLCVALGLAVPALSAEPLAVAVTAAQVTERKDVDDATKKELKARKEKARDARKALEKQIKDQYGKKRETWPEQKEAELETAEEAEALASAAYEYLKVKPKELKDSVKDINKEFDGMVKRGAVTLVASEKEADVVLQVEGRRGEKTLPTYFKPDRCYVLFSLGAGGKTGAAKRFKKVPAGWRPRKVSSYKVQAPKPERPVFVFESKNGAGAEIGCFSSAADAAVKTLEKMIEDNRVAFGAK